jgi:hypothetical protein
MPLISQKVPNLLGGVSQQDERLRRPNQGDEQLNGLSDPSRGLSKRPPSEYVALLDATVASYDTAWVHTINRDLDDKYRVILRDGDLKVFDWDGNEVTVVFPEGKAYLAESTVGPNFRAVTVEDTTFIVNQEFVVTKGAAKEPAQAPEALIWIREASEEIWFRLTLDGDAAPKYQTTATTFAKKVDTTSVAHQLKLQLDALENAADYTFEEIGPVIFVKRVDGGEFSLTGTDGLGNQGMVILKGTAQNVDELPPKAKHGFTVRVLGEQGTDEDDFYVSYRETPTTGFGVWEEVRAPGSILSLDNTTMPHQLILRGTLADEDVAAGAPAPAQSTLGWQSEYTTWWDDYFPGPSGPWETGLDAIPLENQSDAARWYIDASLNGLQVEFELDFLLTATSLTIGERVDLTWERYNSADVLQETLWSDSWYRQTSTLWLSPTAITSVTSGDYLKMTMTYAGGATPTAKATAEMNNSLGTNSLIAHYGRTQDVDFGSAIMYPGGFYIRCAVGGTDYDYTPTSDETGAAVASGLAALVTADPDYTATASDGVLTITYIGGTNPAAVISYEFDQAFDAWFPELDLSGLTLTGTGVTNVSDGSTGTITAQPSSTTVSTSGLTGGTDNVFAENDLIRFTEGGTFFVFRSVDWEDRPAGDEVTNPFPDFTGRTLTDVTYYQGRLGVIYKDRLAMSAAGNLKLWFNHSARILRDDDPIQAESALPQVAAFDSAITWNKALYLRSENAIVYVGGDPRLGLTPRTIRMDLAAAVDSSAKCPPIVVGKSLFIARPRKPMGIQVMELRQAALDVLEYVDITDHVPTYLCGRPIQIAGTGGQGLMFLLPTDCTTNVLYVSQWTLPEGSEILAIDVIDGTLGLVMKYSDGVYLETIDLDEGI